MGEKYVVQTDVLGGNNNAMFYVVFSGLWSCNSLAQLARTEIKRKLSMAFFN